MAEKNKGNLKAQRSKQKIAEALIELMKNKSFYDITIQELTDKAGLSRRTFYRNFSSKEEIIKHFLKKIWYEYEQRVSKEEEHSLKNIAYIFFSTLEDHSVLLQLFNKDNLLVLFLGEASNLMFSAYEKRQKEVDELSEKNIQYVTLFVSGGFFQIAIRWLREGMQESPEEIAEFIEAIPEIYP